MERIVYPGSFRPFHNGHLENVKVISKLYPEGEMIIAVSDRCSRSSIDLKTATNIVRLSIPEDLLSRIKIVDVSPNPILTFSKLKSEKITHVATGSNSTLSFLNFLKLIGYWNGDIIELQNLGIHATQIRDWIKIGDPKWKKYMSSNAVSFLESKV